MPRNRSQSRLVLVVNTAVKVFGFVLLPIVFLYKLSDRASLRKRNSNFASDIADAYGGLIAQYQGNISPGIVTERGGSLDYVEASLEFADRTLRFVRGRDELTVSCNGSPLFSGDSSALYRSASFVEKHWDELIEADYNQIQQWLKRDA